MREPLQAPPMLSQIMAGDGIPWVRLVTAVVLVGLSLAIGYRSGREPPRPDAVPLPVQRSVVQGVELPPLWPSDAGAPLPSPTAVALAGATPAETAGRAEPQRLRERRQVVRARHPRPERVATRPRRDGMSVAASESGTMRGGVRTRDQVRREYLRSRDVVAALTGEDSGSAYLMRLAARQRAARPEVPGQRRG